MTSDGDFHKKTFENISPGKRQRIIDVAIIEFAEKGFNAANINVIAEKAGVSIGSMYSYFDSKDNLFLTLMDHAYHLLEEALSTIDVEGGDLYENIEKMLRMAIASSRKFHRMTQIYLDTSTEGLQHLSKKLSRNIESITAELYMKLLDKARKDGVIADDLDDHVVSFCLDNLILIVQYSFASQYFKERMKVFIGEDIFSEEKRLIQGVMRFIRGALEPRKETTRKN